MEKNALEEVRDGLKYLWVHRKGMEAYAGVYDAIEALYPKNLKPIIFKRFRKGDGWEFFVNLPAGLAYADFKKKEQIFADAVGGTVQISKSGKLITMVVSTKEIKREYAYSFNPADYDGFLPVHFGYSAIGEIVRDLADIVNLIIAGHPKAGKSNFIHGMVIGLLRGKYEVRIVLLDFKRLDYSYLKDHVLLITEIEYARSALQYLNKLLDERIKILESAGVVSLQEYYNEGYEMPWIVVIVDELAEMQDEQCQTLLNRILRLGRAAGMCCVCATQRPSSTMFKAFGDSKAMFSGTLCYHVRDEVNSRMLLDNDRAALIPNIPGRGIYQWDDELEVQTMYLPVKKARKMLKEIKGGEVFYEGIQPPKRLPPR